MASDRTALETQVKYGIGNRTDLDADITRWVQRAYGHLTQAVEFPEARATTTQALTATQRSYDLPSDFFSIYSVRNNTQNKAMIQNGPREYDQRNTTITGPTEYYAIFGVNPSTSARLIHVHPTPIAPADTIQIRYRKIFSALPLATSTSELPEVWEQPIVHFALAFAFDSLNELERASYFRSAAARFIVEQSSRLGADLVDRNEAVQVIGGEI